MVCSEGSQCAAHYARIASAAVSKQCTERAACMPDGRLTNWYINVNTWHALLFRYNSNSHYVQFILVAPPINFDIILDLCIVLDLKPYHLI